MIAYISYDNSSKVLHAISKQPFAHSISIDIDTLTYDSIMQCPTDYAYINEQLAEINKFANQDEM